MQYQGRYNDGKQIYSGSHRAEPREQHSNFTLRPLINVTSSQRDSPPIFSGNLHEYFDHNQPPVLSEYANFGPSNTEMTRSQSIPHLCTESREGVSHWPSAPVLNFRQCRVPMNFQTQLIQSPPNFQVCSELSHMEHPVYPEIHAFGSPNCLSNQCISPEMLTYQPVYTNHVQVQQNNEALMFKLLCEQKDGQLKRLQQQLESTNDYLKVLPTNDQLRNLKEDCTKSESDKKHIMNKYKELKLTLDKIKADLKQKNFYIEQLEKKNLRYQDKIEALNQFILNPNSDVDEDKENTIREIQLFKKKLKNFQQANNALQINLHALREKLEEENNLIQAQKKELRYKEESICSLKAQMKEADAKRNQLLEDNLTLEEKVKTLSLNNSEAEERYVLEKKLFLKLRLCVAELKAIAEIVDEHVSGGNPNMSFLLGNHVHIVQSDSIYNGPTKNTILNEINEAEDLKKKLSNLREDLSDKYAEHLGANLKCLTQ